MDNISYTDYLLTTLMYTYPDTIGVKLVLRSKPSTHLRYFVFVSVSSTSVENRMFAN